MHVTWDSLIHTHNAQYNNVITWEDLLSKNMCVMLTTSPNESWKVMWAERVYLCDVSQVHW